MTKLINGKKLAQVKTLRLQRRLKKWQKQHQTEIVLISLVADEDKLGQLYTNLKQKAAQNIGLEFKKISFSLKQPSKTISLIKKACQQKNLKGLIIQKPNQSTSQKYFKTKKDFQTWWSALVKKIPPQLDVDGLNPASPVYPATVKAVYSALTSILPEKKLAGKRAVIIGSSDILGKPLALLLRDKGMTVIIFGSSEKKPAQLCRLADILIGCVGKPNLITGRMVKPGAIVIDAGMSVINRQAVGDVDFKSISRKAAYLTPVPGGIGPLTVVSLLENLFNILESDS